MRLRNGLASVILVAGAACMQARADAVTDWNSTALSVTQLSAGFGGGSFMQVRALARLHAAVFDTVNGIDRKYAPYVVDERAPPGVSLDAAVAAAAHTVLVEFVPLQRGAIDRAYEAALSGVGDAAAKEAGIAFGRRIATQHLARFANDRVTDTAVFKVPPPAPGVWQLTPQFTVPIQYAWRLVPPMVIKETPRYDLFGGPPKLDSAQFARDYEEVKTLGARDSTQRSAEQTAVAVYWTVQTMIPWNRAAQAASRAAGYTPAQNARLFAQLNLAAHDAQIVIIDQKYRYNFWRPYNAIRYPGGPGGKLAGDPKWEPLINTPGFPDYPSGHCTTSGAALGVLLAHFPDDKVEVSDTFVPGTGVVRSWSSFTGMAKDVENARVWGGIHFRTADEQGTQMGRRIGEDVMELVMRPLG